MDLYLPKTVEKFFKISKERFASWRKADFVRPTIYAVGQGKRSYYSKYDIIRIKIFIHLINSGLRRKQAGEISNKISNADIDEKNFVVFIWDKEWDRFLFHTLADYLQQNSFDEYYILNLKGFLKNFKIDLQPDQ